jgi:TolB protein
MGARWQSIFCHDLDNIYYIDLDGNVLKKWELSKILTDASMNSGDRLSISPDGNALLMDVDCGSEHERKNWDGPQPAIEKLDLDGKNPKLLVKHARTPTASAP